MKVLKHFYAKEYIGKYPSDKNVLIKFKITISLFSLIRIIIVWSCMYCNFNWNILYWYIFKKNKEIFWYADTSTSEACSCSVQQNRCLHKLAKICAIVHGEMWLALVSVNSEEIAIIISYIIKEEENILQQKQKWKT